MTTMRMRPATSTMVSDALARAESSMPNAAMTASTSTTTTAVVVVGASTRADR